MYGFLALCMFGFAYWLNKKLQGKRHGLIALLVGFAGSMLLYQSPASMEIATWSDNHFLGTLASNFGGWIGEPLPTGTVWSVLCIGGFVMTLVDLRYDHTYNPWAIAALIITPVAAKGSGSGVVTGFIDWLHSGGAWVVAWAVGGAVGS
ncbi:hypothetical protein [Streptomonospora wellingtoniae]|uniref:Uncharacterized protein n=1 Tax=Streptomonospora wellingtoniae TaxID=3075544 RepID=A0ABU2L0I0_9ACTN|nr:hypothetical protein [Streptomonospora sp. DSM 45055]MDT0305043.1 hypothetical protein [Streptomonospora sp. DSM 45055]